MGKMKSRTNSSRRSRTCTLRAPVRSALSRMGISSSPCPRSAQKATTSQRYRSISQRRMTDVSRPPEYARTTRLTDAASGIFDGRAEEIQDDGLLGVETILGLVQHDAGVAVERGVRDLLAPMRGQAVHDQGPGPREPQHRLV